MNKTELHLFIIWERGRYQQDMILNDIQQKFSVIEVIEVEWEKQSFARNLTRFYGESLPDNSHKQKECGTGEFLLITVLDDNPNYAIRQSSKGPKSVNVRLFDCKELYRSWSGGGHKIHATNTTQECMHDLYLLTGVTYRDYLHSSCSQPQQGCTRRTLHRDLTGHSGWHSLRELFLFLNETSRYVVLRNFDSLPDSAYINTHCDIDLLTDSLHNIVYLLNATPVFKQHYRVHYNVNINGSSIRFDFRYLGDNYYDHRWQQHILEHRIFCNDVYRPADEDYRYSLLYHALIHKFVISEDYMTLLQKLGFHKDKFNSSLTDYLTERDYQITSPYDLSVAYNRHGFKAGTSIRRLIHESLLRSRTHAARLLPSSIKHVLRKFL